MTTIAAVENLILARLGEPAFAARFGFSFRDRLTYPENFDAWLMAEKGEVRCPAAWVVFAGWRGTEMGYDQDGETQLTVDASFGVMVADENNRPAEQYQRHGGPDAAKEPGSYRLATAAMLWLAGQDLGELVTPLAPGALSPVRPSEAIVKRRWSMYAGELTCRFILTADPDDRAAPAELGAIHANWDIPAIGDPVPVDADPVAPGPQLPDDFHADATDHLSLESDPT